MEDDRPKILKLWGAILDIAPAGVAAFDTEMRYIEANERWKLDYGLDGRDIIGCSHYDVLPGIPEPWRELHRRCLAGETLRAEADPFQRTDGRTEWVRWQIRPWHLSSGAVGGIVIFAEFITARIEAEQALKASEARLRQEEAKYRTTIDLAPVGIIHVNADGRFLMVNPFFCNLLGYDRGALLSMTALDLTIDDDKPESQVSLARQAAGIVRNGRMVKRYRHRDGHPIWAEVTFVTEADPGHGEFYGLAIINDITARRQAEAERLRFAAQLQQAQKMEAVGQLTGGLAHDFNNLLGVIVGNLDFLAELPGLPESARELVDGATEAALRGAELTRNLLAFARRQPLAPAVTEIAEVLRRAGQLLTRTLGGNIKLEVQPGDALWPVLIDVPQLESAILNLAVNARDAMQEGGRLTIEARNVTLDADDCQHNAEAAAGDYVVVTVSDTGAGMPPEIAAKAFEPFFTTKGARGSGLGLSMVHGFVRQSGGHTRLYSEAGRGTRIDLYLPRAVPTAVAAAPKAPPPLERGRAGETVLVVEDNDALRRLAVRRLEELGYRSVAARDGGEALTVLQGAMHIDLLFTDMVMPGGLDGRQLAAAARALRPDLKVLFTSGFTDAIAADNSERDLGQVLLTKPYQKAMLAHRIRATLDGG
jgi:PAS domain S-box-containing protein